MKKFRIKKKTSSRITTEPTIAQLNSDTIKQKITDRLQTSEACDCNLDIDVLAVEELELYIQACTELQHLFTARKVTPVLRYVKPKSEDEKDYTMLLLAFVEASKILSESSDFSGLNWRNALLGKAWQQMQEMSSTELQQHIKEAFPIFPIHN